MTQWMLRLWLDDDGQDLIEYTLLMTFIVLATMWLFGTGQPAVNAIWTGANNTISQANTSAS
jgi:Flp pilus assembly pilin Flp